MTLRVGVIGLGEIAQVSHLNVLNNLSDYYSVTYLCDVSKQALEHAASKVAGSRPRTTTVAEELCSSPDVDVVLVCNATAFHPAHTILALQSDKSVLVEKPVALCYRDIDAIIAAERTSKGRVFVGYQRRYAEAFLDAVAEVGGMGNILYARVRDIIGPNSTFVDQSGTFPKRPTDFDKASTAAMMERDEEMVRQAVVEDYGVEVTPLAMNMVRILGGLGTHDLSAMREMLGMPKSVRGASLAMPFWSALLQYEGFALVYESGINNVAVFDAHIEVYSQDKIVRVNYDTPYIKGLPVTMTIREKIDGAKGPGFQERIVRKTYEDPYTLEFLEFHECVAHGKAIKTTAEDARNDLDLFKMIMQAGFG
ncbi:NAD(P)-binding protein [Saccharata proteae CBS 121410]|uniref:NAD(P)-binding protein n=1 Tax=Saccharata proteae CBS 121410 TaxID=1314787 RepID=A0A9P4HTR1_9PEZI|nr:NAD(P)-binding protein [Saccharata proteae CBS 121410]